MQEQLELWPMEQGSAASLSQWETVGQEGQDALIAMMARVMIKAVDPNERAENQENNHEQ